jgi:hypothetical protein
MRIIDFEQKRGKHCFVEDYQGNTLVLKIFDAYPQKDFEGLGDFLWGDLPVGDNPNMSVKLVDATKIQNIAWMFGLAPRVFEIVGVKYGSQKYFAQIIEKVRGKHPENKHEVFAEPYYRVKKLGVDFGFETEKDDVSRYDVIDDKLVDFNTFHFEDNYLDKIKAIYINWARYGKVYYHNVPEWGLTGGPRKNEERVKWMGLDKIDFNGKDVFDLGCAGGFFCREAKRRGAESVAGIDMNGEGGGQPVKAAQLASNMLGYWDINFIDRDLRKLQKPICADIIFFLSMNYHIGIPEWLGEATGELCIFEDNSKERNAEAQLKKMFKRVEQVGQALDHGDKPILYCYK